MARPATSSRSPGRASEMNRSLYRDRYLLVACSFAAGTALGFAFVSLSDKGAVAAAEKAKPASVPFEMLDSNHMVVKATINGKGPFRLVFDLGAPITLLGNRAAEVS